MKFLHRIQFNKTGILFSITEQIPAKKDESGQSCCVDESPQDKKSIQRHSLPNRIKPKLDSSAFSADNESSVYAFEAETDSPPVNRPFRRRSKTLSRSDEEDSTSIGSASNPISVHVISTSN